MGRYIRLALNLVGNWAHGSLIEDPLYSIPPRGPRDSVDPMIIGYRVE